MSDTNDKYFFTPSFRVVRQFLWRINERKKVGRIMVGNDKYQVQGFFDPSAPEVPAFFGSLRAVLAEAGATKEQQTAALLEAFPLHKDVQKQYPEIPETWRRLTANTQFGPVEVINRANGAVKEAEFFPGVWAIAQVSGYPFEDQKTGEHRIALRLGPVLLDRTDSRLKVSAGPTAKAVFAGIVGGTSARDPFAASTDD